MKFITVILYLTLVVFVNCSGTRKNKKQKSIFPGPKDFRWTALDLKSTLSWKPRSKWKDMNIHYEIYFCYGDESIHTCKDGGFHLTTCEVEYKDGAVVCRPDIYPRANSCGIFQLKTYLCDGNSDPSSFNCSICNCTKSKYADHCLTTISEFSSPSLTYIEPTSTQVNFKIQLPSEHIQTAYDGVVYNFKVMRLGKDSDICGTKMPDFEFQKNGIEEGSIDERCNNRTDTGCPWTVTNLRPDTFYCFYGGFKPINSRHLSAVAYQKFQTKKENPSILVIIYVVISIVSISLAAVSVHWILKVWKSMKVYARETPPAFLLEIKLDMENLKFQQSGSLNYQSPRQLNYNEIPDKFTFQRIQQEERQNISCNYVTVKTGDDQTFGMETKQVKSDIRIVNKPTNAKKHNRDRPPSGDGGYGSTDEDKQHRNSGASMAEYISMKSTEKNTEGIQSVQPLLKEEIPTEKMALSLDDFRKNTEQTASESRTSYTTKFV